MKKIVVIGSISTDFVAQSLRFPQVGETIEGHEFGISFGGKGANQAVAAGRLHNNVEMIGAVGDDLFGQNLISNLESNSIKANHVKQIPNQSSGAAVIVVAEKNNQIVYTPGANNDVSKDLIDQAEKELLTAGIVVLQNEIPQDVIEYIIDKCYEADVPVLLNPAPARHLSADYIDKITYFTPNETEFAQIFGKQTEDAALAELPNKLIITLGDQGVKFHNGKEVVVVPAIEAKEVRDTTGAGDTFNGALAVGIVNDLSLYDAIRLGNLAASISIEKFGAQGGSPTLAELIEREAYEEAWDIG